MPRVFHRSYWQKPYIQKLQEHQDQHPQEHSQDQRPQNHALELLYPGDNEPTDFQGLWRHQQLMSHELDRLAGLLAELQGQFEAQKLVRARAPSLRKAKSQLALRVRQCSSFLRPGSFRSGKSEVR